VCRREGHIPQVTVRHGAATHYEVMYATVCNRCDKELAITLQPGEKTPERIPA
jgi:hypothetical protein